MISKLLFFCGVSLTAGLLAAPAFAQDSRNACGYNQFVQFVGVITIPGATVGLLAPAPPGVDLGIAGREPFVGPHAHESWFGGGPYGNGNGNVGNGQDFAHRYEDGIGNGWHGGTFGTNGVGDGNRG